MRLKTRLALAFAVLATAPLAVVVPRALSDLRRTLSSDLQSRVASAQAAAATVVEQLSSDVQRGVDDLAEAPALEEMAKALHAHAAGPEVAGAAERLMRGRGLSVLALFDASGTTLSSGHLPARLGDRDEALFSVTRESASSPVSRLVEMRDAAGVHRAPALVAARPMDYGDLRLWVVGGLLLDDKVAERLSRVTGGKVEILTPEGSFASAGAATGPAVERWAEVPPTTRIRVSYDTSAYLAAQRGIARAFAFLVALGLAFAIGLGLWLAGRITRPVEALTAAAREVAAGDLNAQVTARAGGEVGELVLAFNRMTKDLLATTERLVASERVAAWQEVARRLAHEIKNPLTPIQMSLETLLAVSTTDTQRFAALFQQSAQGVLEEVGRLKRIVDEFSRFARLPKPDKAPTDLTGLLTQVLQIYGQSKVDAELEPQVWVEADKDQLTQVILNLLKNAEEATPAGGRITLRLLRSGPAAQLHVTDSGPGIPVEARARIFEPYFTTKAAGTGLGLAIASRICQEHGGTLEAGGEPGAGATFTLTLPVCAHP